MPEGSRAACELRFVCRVQEEVEDEAVNVRERNTDPETAIFTLSFGRNADFSMLKLLSLQNHAFSRKIYIAADASLQLEGFYKEVSS